MAVNINIVMNVNTVDEHIAFWSTHAYIYSTEKIIQNQLILSARTHDNFIGMKNWLYIRIVYIDLFSISIVNASEMKSMTRKFKITLHRHIQCSLFTCDGYICLYLDIELISRMHP